MNNNHSYTITFDHNHNHTKVQQFRKAVAKSVLLYFSDVLREKDKLFLKNVSTADFLNAIILKKFTNDVKKDSIIIDSIGFVQSSYPALRFFHNHNEASEKQVRYPLVQYRSFKGRPQLIAFGDAIPLVKEWIVSNQRRDGFSLPYISEQPKSANVIIQSSDTPIYYRLMDWLALNTENYNRWKSTPLMKDRILILEQALTGHIRRIVEVFGEAKMEEAPIAELVLLANIKTVQGYHHKDMAFNVIFRSNVQIPECLAIGKSVSIGFGTQQKTKTQWQGENTDFHAQLQSELSAVGSAE